MSLKGIENKNAKMPLQSYKSWCPDATKKGIFMGILARCYNLSSSRDQTNIALYNFVKLMMDQAKYPANVLMDWVRCHPDRICIKKLVSMAAPNILGAYEDEG